MSFYQRIFVLLLLRFLSTVSTTCLKDGIQWQNSCLYYNTTTTGFMAAEEYCQGIGGHLVSIHDAFTNAFISDWRNGEPGASSDKQCILVDVNPGFWTTEGCSHKRPFICSISTGVVTSSPSTTTTPPPQKPSTRPMLNPPTAQPYKNCSFGWVYFEPTNSCYGYSNKGLTMNWTMAEIYCNNQDAHLASVHSYEELMFINEFGLISLKSVWLGLYSDDLGRTWKWTDGT
uniref:C-type lectin domain-containing protein n=1 Tax=Panagrolaimus davidi TaxID=227884 RepID=A0A914Q5N1_9BILA